MPLCPRSCSLSRLRTRRGSILPRVTYVGLVGTPSAWPCSSRSPSGCRVAFSVIGRGPERAPLEAEASQRGLRNVEFTAHVDPFGPARELPRRRHPVRAGTEHPDARPDCDAVEARGVHGVGKAGHLCRQRPRRPPRSSASAPASRSPRRSPAIETAIQALLGDPRRAVALGAAGRAYARSRREERVLSTALLAAIEELELVTEPAHVLHVCDFAAPYGGSFIRQLELLDAELRRRGRGPSAYGFPEDVRGAGWCERLRAGGSRCTFFHGRRRVRPASASRAVGESRGRDGLRHRALALRHLRPSGRDGGPAPAGGVALPDGARGAGRRARPGQEAQGLHEVRRGRSPCRQVRGRDAGARA